MIHYEEWADYCLLVGFNTYGSSGVKTALLNCASQSTFIQWVLDTYGQPPTHTSVTALTAASFDVLSEAWDQRGLTILEGD